MPESKDKDCGQREGDPIELKVEYKRMNAFFADFTRNICSGGTFIETEKPLAVGTRFLFRLSVPALPEPLSIAGEVRWVIEPQDVDATSMESDVVPGMGIEFVYETQDEARKMREQIESLMVDSLGRLVTTKLMEQAVQ